jgi:hypothetical protein
MDCKGTDLRRIIGWAPAGYQPEKVYVVLLVARNTSNITQRN